MCVAVTVAVTVPNCDPWLQTYIGANLNRVDVVALVRALPQLLDDLVDLLHFRRVVLHQGPKIKAGSDTVQK